MDALILASGIGKRLGNLGKDKPKCLLNVFKNIKILDLILNNLKNIKNIYIVVGFKKNLIKKHLQKNMNNIHFIENKFYKNKGNFFSVLLARNLIKDDLILLDGDIILPKNELKRFVMKRKRNLVMTNPLNNYNQDDITLKVNSKKKITDIFVKKKHKKRKNFYAASSVIKMSKKAKNTFFSELNNIHRKKRKNDNSCYEDTYSNLFKKHSFKISVLKKERFEIDTHADYKKAIKVVKKNNFYV